MGRAPTQVNVLLSTMRAVTYESPFVAALLSLERQEKVTVTTVSAQASQEDAARKLFPKAEFLERGLGSWPKSDEISYANEAKNLLTRVTSLASFVEFKRDIITNLNRHDSSGTFRVVDREAYFYQSLLEILSIISRNCITHLFFDITPHVSRDYMLFWVGKALGLRVLFLQPVPWAGLALVKSDLAGSVPPNPGIWAEAREGETAEFLEYTFTQGKALIENLREANASWVTRYQSPEIRKLAFRTFSPWKVIRSIRGKMLGQNSIIFSGLERLGSIERLLAVFLEWQLRRDFLRERQSIIENYPSTSGDYIFLALTHEPERTFFPEALPHDSQYHVALQISAGLMPDQKLVMKEHETQFVPGRRGYASRSKQFYRTLDKVPGIEFVSSTASSKSLVDGSLAVVSATGTISIEAALKGKPSYYFGNPWWAGFPGTCKLDNFAKVPVTQCNPPTRESVEEWLVGFVTNCIPTTSNVELHQFSQKFATLPDYFAELEKLSIQLTLEDFISQTVN